MSPQVFPPVGQFDFRIYFNDHEPKHVHVFASGKQQEAQFQLEPIQLIKSYGYHERDLGRIERIIRDRLEEIIQKWDGIHGEGNVNQNDNSE